VQWIAPSEKDAASDALEKRLINFAQTLDLLLSNIPARFSV
jgi:hypothetical protein